MNFNEDPRVLFAKKQAKVIPDAVIDIMEILYKYELDFDMIPALFESVDCLLKFFGKSSIRKEGYIDMHLFKKELENFLEKKLYEKINNQNKKEVKKINNKRKEE